MHFNFTVFCACPFTWSFLNGTYAVLPFYSTTTETVPFFYYAVSCRISTDKTGSVCPVYVESFSCVLPMARALCFAGPKG